MAKDAMVASPSVKQADLDSNRKAAEWVLSIRGTVQLNGETRDHHLTAK